MQVGQLFRDVPNAQIGADPSLAIVSLAYDSRRVEAGSLFFAVEGNKADGHDFVPAALQRGAVAIVSERPAPPEVGSRWIRVEKIRRALSQVSRTFYGHPDSKLQLIGITGTNGKTTTAFLVDSILRTAGVRAGVLGTIEYRLGERTIPAVNTTPESLDLFSYFAELVQAGAAAAVMEVSSHALAQERVWGLYFSVAVFTNLTRDHLDYHKDFVHYFGAKRRLFEGLGAPPPELAVINADDAWGLKLSELALPRTITFGFGSGAQIKVKHFSQGLEGIQATLMTPKGKLQVESPLLGRVNVANILAATGVGLGLEISTEAIAEGIRNLRTVPGRFERIDEGQPFLVVVDYAHTDDALRNALATARELTENRVIAVFGCGGERDRTKRPAMGEVAGSMSDLVVLTSDNPRGEDPLLIMSDVLVGLQKTGRPYIAEVDREAAIRKAFGAAREGDAVVLAGKGHEAYQVLKDRRIPFDDREVARKILHDIGFPKHTTNSKGARSPCR